MTAEVALVFQHETFFQMVIQAVEGNASKDPPGDFQHGDAPMVVAELAVTFPLMEMDDCGVLEVLRDFSMTPPLLDERRQMFYKLGATAFVVLSRDRVRSGRFPIKELLHGPDGFLERGREVEVGDGLHLRQMGGSGIIDGGGTVEDASEVFGSSPLNLSSQ
nr:unnamed protein product [Spirometra erinaceieuropaei]